MTRDQQQSVLVDSLLMILQQLLIPAILYIHALPGSQTGGVISPLEFFQYPSSLHIYLSASHRDNKNKNNWREQLGIVLKPHRSDTPQALLDVVWVSFVRSPLSLLQAHEKVTPHHSLTPLWLFAGSNTIKHQNYQNVLSFQLLLNEAYLANFSVCLGTCP